MILLLCGAVLLVLTAFAVRCAAARSWHYLAIAALSVPLFPLAGVTVTGDVSRYLPDWAFSEGAGLKDQIVGASIVATLLVAVMAAAVLVWIARHLWLLTRNPG